MTPSDFQYIAELLKARSGLILTADKTYLLESRLLPIARKKEPNTFENLIAKMRMRDEALIAEVVEAMTTNESFFFRDMTPFNIFKTHVLPKLLTARAGARKVRIWSAAASTGQEPYSLAMIIDQMKPQLAGWQFEIIGTDLSTEVLRKARTGLYSQFEVQRGLPSPMLVKYFKKNGEQWQVASHIRDAVQYRELNLLEDFSSLGKFDIIFCRNVLIYFDQPTKAHVLERMARLLPEDGSLFLGAAETVLGITTRFQAVKDQRGLYALASTTHSDRAL